MKDDLKRLINEFIEETYKFRKVKKDLQYTSDMPERYEYFTREPTLQDLILWLNNQIEEEDY